MWSRKQAFSWYYEPKLGSLALQSADGGCQLPMCYGGHIGGLKGVWGRHSSPMNSLLEANLFAYL